MRLSELNPKDILGVTPPPTTAKAGGAMRLSDLDPNEIAEVSQPGLIQHKPFNIADSITDAAIAVGRPIKEKVLDPLMNALDYAGAPVRAGVAKYQSLPDSEQFSPKGIARAGVEGARFLKDEILGNKAPKDAPTVGDIYERSDLRRAIDRPAITDAVGNFLLRSGTQADPLRMQPGTEIDTREVLGDEYDQKGKEVGKIVTNLAGETIAGGLMDPTNIIIPAAGGLLKKGAGVADDAARAGANALRQGYKARVAEAVGSMSDTPKAPPTPPAPPTTPGKLTAAKELSKYVEASKQAGLSTDLPAAKALERAEALTTDLRHPILPAQKKATINMADRDTYRALKDSGTKTAATISEYEQLQRGEAVKKIKDTIDELSPSKAAKTDELEVGEKLKNDFVSQYQAKKADLGKAFEKYDKTPIDPTEHIPFLTEKIAARAPGITDFIDVVDETAQLKPYTPAMGISKVEYDTLAQVVDTLNTQPLTIKQIRNIRGSLLNAFPDPLTRPPMVNAIRGGMLDHIRDLVAKKNAGKSKQVFETFKNYAINEQNLDDLEHVFGGSFSEFAQGRKNVVPERVLNRIFSNSRNAKIARKALGEDAYNEAFASYLGSKMKSFMNGEDKFSSRRFGEWLRKNRTVLNATAPDKTKLDRLEALSTILRFTSDDLPINPSGTAKTYGLLNDVWGAVKQPTGVVDAVVGTPVKAGMAAFNNLRKNRGAANTYNRLSGESGLLQKAFEKTVSPEHRALLKRFIEDEEGAFTPKDLQQILKPGEENVFDLKTARGMAGEPKRGLLEPKDNPVAKYRPPLSREERADLLNWIDSAYDSLRRGEKLKPVDEQYLREVLPVAPDYQKKYVKDLLETIEKQKAGGAEEIARSMGGRAEIPGVKTPAGPHNVKQGDILYRASNPDGGELRVLEYDPTTDNYLVSDGLGKSWRKSDELVASKDAGKGLLTSLDVERGPVKELPEAGDAIPFNDDARMKLDRQRSSAQSGQFKPGQLIADEDGRNFKILDVNPKTGMIMLETPDGGRSFEYADTLAEYLNDVKNAPALMNETKGAIDAATAAEAERLKKGLIGVDFGGRGGKVPKPKTALDRYAELKERSDGVSARVNKRMAEQEKNFKPAPNTEDVFKFFESKGAKPKPIYEKNGVKIYTKDSNSFGDQIIHYSVGDGPRKTETFSEGSHMDLDTFADIYGPKKKPKGGKGKPKKKK